MYMRLGHYLLRLLLLPFLGSIYKDDFPSVRVSIKKKTFQSAIKKLQYLSVSEMFSQPRVERGQ